MKIFIDTANINEIQKWSSTGLIAGVTTNPTHLSLQNGSSLEIIKDICSLMESNPISVQVTETMPEALYIQALKISRIADTIVVKIPCQIANFSVIKRLIHEGIKINVTLVFSVAQALAMCTLGATYISPFVGRLDDAGQSGIQVLSDIVAMVKYYGFGTQVLAASIRNVEQFNGALACHADICTVPPSFLATAFNHPLTESGAQKFLDDWKSLGISVFP